jgi:hypothetical protein
MRLYSPNFPVLALSILVPAACIMKRYVSTIAIQGHEGAVCALIEAGASVDLVGANHG